MIDMQLFINDENFDVEDIIVKNLGGVSRDLINNPQFKSQLYDAIRYLIRKRKSSDLVPPLELVVRGDGKGFEMRSGVRQSPECGNEFLQNNRSYNQVSFTIDEYNDMEVLKSNGVFYHFDDYMKIDMDPAYKNKFKISNSRQTPVIISTFHEHRTFMQSGVEVERSYFSDRYPLSCGFEDDSSLKRETMVHSPIKWNYDIMPDNAAYEFVPSVTKIYRFTNSLGIVHVQSRENNGPLHAAAYAASTEYPDILGYTPVAYKKYENGNEIISDEYKGYYPGMAIWEIEREIGKAFYRGIGTSKSQETKPEICDKMREMTIEGLTSMYTIDLDELTSSRSK